MWILVIPWILCVLVLLCLMCVYKRWRKVSAIAFVLVLGLNWWYHVFSFGWFSTIFSSDRRVITVMSWNIDGSEFDSMRINNINQFIKVYSPDVIFLAEDFDAFTNPLDSLLSPTYQYSTKNLDYWHYMYSIYPITRSHIINAENSNLRLNSYCRIRIDQKNLNIYGCHLASNNYSPDNDDFHLDSVDGHSALLKYLNNIKAASELRTKEAEAIINDYTKSDGCPTIIMGDMNDISGSAPLRIFEPAGFTDAWWKGGFGYGATIHHPLPYRIDHIMYNDGLKLKSIKKIDADGLSDHDALVAEFYFNNNENSMNDWYTWVFSGIGVAILGWVGAFFYRKRKNVDRNAEIKGNNNVTNQNSDNSSISIN